MKCLMKWLGASLAIAVLASAALMAGGQTEPESAPPAPAPTVPASLEPVQPAPARLPNGPALAAPAVEEAPIVYCCGGGPPEWLLTNTQGATAPKGKGPDSGKENKWCCGGENLIHNGDFEHPVNPKTTLGFDSDYKYNPAIKPDATLPGQYNIVTKEQAIKICRQWNVKDEYACRGGAGDSHFIVVNGETGKTGTVSIWKQKVNVVRGKQYVFCARVRHLPSCCFDVRPIVTVKFGEATPDTLGPITVNQAVAGSDCGWQLLQQTVTATGSVMIIDIRLDVSGVGDGNDLALDNISLQPVTSLALDFNLYKKDAGAGKYTIDPAILTINGTEITKLPQGCTAVWKLYKYDPTMGMDTFQMNWTTPNASFNFPGYQAGASDPGKFDDTQWYHLTVDLQCKNATGCSSGGFAEGWWKFKPTKTSKMLIEKKQPARETGTPKVDPPPKTDGAKATLSLHVVERLKSGAKIIERPVDAAKITVRQEGKVIDSGSTDANGVHRFMLPAGTYQVVVTKPGFKTSTMQVMLGAKGASPQIVLTR